MFGEPLITIYVLTIFEEHGLWKDDQLVLDVSSVV